MGLRRRWALGGVCVIGGLGALVGVAAPLWAGGTPISGFPLYPGLTGGAPAADAETHSGVVPELAALAAALGRADADQLDVAKAALRRWRAGRDGVLEGVSAAALKAGWEALPAPERGSEVLRFQSDDSREVRVWLGDDEIFVLPDGRLRVADEAGTLTYQEWNPQSPPGFPVGPEGPLPEGYEREEDARGVWVYVAGSGASPSPLDRMPDMAAMMSSGQYDSMEEVAEAAQAQLTQQREADRKRAVRGLRGGGGPRLFAADPAAAGWAPLCPTDDAKGVGLWSRGGLVAQARPATREERAALRYFKPGTHVDSELMALIDASAPPVLRVESGTLVWKGRILEPPYELAVSEQGVLVGGELLLPAVGRPERGLPCKWLALMQDRQQALARRLRAGELVLLTGDTRLDGWVDAQEVLGGPELAASLVAIVTGPGAVGARVKALEALPWVHRVPTANVLTPLVAQGGRGWGEVDLFAWPHDLGFELHPAGAAAHARALDLPMDLWDPALERASKRRGVWNDGGPAVSAFVDTLNPFTKGVQEAGWAVTDLNMDWHGPVMLRFTRHNTREQIIYATILSPDPHFDEDEQALGGFSYVYTERYSFVRPDGLPIGPEGQLPGWGSWSEDALGRRIDGVPFAGLSHLSEYGWAPLCAGSDTGGGLMKRAGQVLSYKPSRKGGSLWLVDEVKAQALLAASPLPAARAATVGSGIIIHDRQVLRPPFDVQLDGLRLSVNGVTLIEQDPKAVKRLEAGACEVASDAEVAYDTLIRLLSLDYLLLPGADFDSQLGQMKDYSRPAKAPSAEVLARLNAVLASTSDPQARLQQILQLPGMEFRFLPELDAVAERGLR